MAAIPKRKIQEWEYLEGERVSPYRSEYYNGEVFAMAGASRRHNDVSKETVREIARQLEGTACDYHVADMKVKSWAGYSYPDIVLVCENAQYDGKDEDILLNPLVILEILSDSTEQFCRMLKFDYYKTIPSFVEYVLIDQSKMCVDYFHKTAKGGWRSKRYTKPTDVIAFKSVPVKLELQKLYAKARLPLAK